MLSVQQMKDLKLFDENMSNSYECVLFLIKDCEDILTVLESINHAVHPIIGFFKDIRAIDFFKKLKNAAEKVRDTIENMYNSKKFKDHNTAEDAIQRRIWINLAQLPIIEVMLKIRNRFNNTIFINDKNILKSIDVNETSINDTNALDILYEAFFKKRKTMIVSVVLGDDALKNITGAGVAFPDLANQRATQYHINGNEELITDTSNFYHMSGRPKLNFFAQLNIKFKHKRFIVFDSTGGYVLNVIDHTTWKSGKTLVYDTLNIKNQNPSISNNRLTYVLAETFDDARGEIWYVLYNTMIKQTKELDTRNDKGLSSLEYIHLRNIVTTNEKIDRNKNLICSELNWIISGYGEKYPLCQGFYFKVLKIMHLTPRCP